YALTRWDWKSVGSISFFDVDYSQDAWIVRGKVEGVDGSFQLGKPGCDSRIAAEFEKAGYKVSNPSKSIKAFHYHNSGVRNYSENERVPGPYLFPKPCELEGARILAMTSMSPREASFDVQKKSVRSWLRAGCEVVAFQPAEDMKHFHQEEWQGVRFIETESSKRFPGYIPISNMTKWAGEQEGYAMLINADCRLCTIPRMLQKIVNGGLTYLVRHDVNAHGQIHRNLWGIDAFIFPTNLAPLI